MTRRKADESKNLSEKRSRHRVRNIRISSDVAVGNITGISGEVNVAGRDIYKGFTAEQVATLLKQITSAFQAKPFDGRCPYKGLDVFEEEDAELFFGRERLVEDLLGHLKDSRTIFITGPSGSGKSSLVRAGLIHALKHGAIKALHSEHWLYETMKPGRNPIEELARVASSLARTLSAGDDILAKGLSDPTVLARWCEIALKDGREKRVVLFVDQFEEAFTQIGNEEQRVAFLNLLTHAATVENGRVIVLFAMRSDFVSNCATYPRLNDLLNQQFVQIGAMQPGDLVSAIAQPALRVGLHMDPDLIAQIINHMEGEPGVLPLMQFALKDLFDSQQEKGGLIALTLSDYLQRGGLHKALERHADDSFAKLNKYEQELARSVFKGLIEIGRGTEDTRRTALLDQLIPANSNEAEVQAVIQKLADARLITTDEKDNRKYTITHEKLIDAWPWLKRLVNENREVIALQNEIANDAQEWDEHQREISYLYSGARLATAQEKIKILTLSENAQAFLKTSINTEEDARQKSRRIQNWILTVSIVFSAIVLGLLILASIQLNVSRAQYLGFQAQAAYEEHQRNVAALYAYQSNQIHKNDAADSVLSRLYYENFGVGKSLTESAFYVASIAWSTDGRLASGSEDGAILIWNPISGQLQQSLKGNAAIYSVAWSADGKLASGSEDGTIIIWDLAPGQQTQILKGNAAFHSVAWASDGRLASGSEDGTIIIWGLATGQPAQVLIGYSSVVTSVAWASDGRLASGSEDGTVIVWDLATGQPAQVLTGYSSVVTSVAWASDGRLASGSSDGTVIIWDLATGQPAQTLKGHTSSVTSVAWSVDGQLASGSLDKTAIIWDLDHNQPTQVLDGPYLGVNSLAWSADGHLASSSNDGAIIIWDPSHIQPAQTLAWHTAAVASVAWSADGLLASASYDGTIIIWDLSNGHPSQTLKVPGNYATSLAWSTDGFLASTSYDGTIIIWDLSSGQPSQTLKASNYFVTSIAWSPNRRLASGSYDGTVIIWDLSSGQPAQILKGHTSSVTSVAWSANGRLASASDDMTIIIWDPVSGQRQQSLKESSAISSVAWSADGRLASGSLLGTVTIWDLFSGQPARSLKGYTGAVNSVNSVAWSTDGRLASGSADGTIMIWNLANDQPPQILNGHTEMVTSVAWSPDGRLASSSWDKTVKIARNDLINAKPCDWIYRNMTEFEWLDYQGSLYTYQPACPNLHVPIFDPLNDIRKRNLNLVLITWKGRGILLGIVLALIAILYFIVRTLYEFIPRIWRIIYKRFQRPPRPA